MISGALFAETEAMPVIKSSTHRHISVLMVDPGKRVQLTLSRVSYILDIRNENLSQRDRFFRNIRQGGFQSYKGHLPPRFSTQEAVELAKDLHRTTEVLQKTIKELRAKNYSHVQEHCIEINRLENRIDRTFRDALGKLFDDIKDPLLIIKWKEIYEHLEDASDRCEDGGS